MAAEKVLGAIPVSGGSIPTLDPAKRIDSLFFTDKRIIEAQVLGAENRVIVSLGSRSPIQQTYAAYLKMESLLEANINVDDVLKLNVSNVYMSYDQIDKVLVKGGGRIIKTTFISLVVKGKTYKYLISTTQLGLTDHLDEYIPLLNKAVPAAKLDMTEFKGNK
jgi:hypothetical protein